MAKHKITGKHRFVDDVHEHLSTQTISGRLTTQSLDQVDLSNIALPLRLMVQADSSRHMIVQRELHYLGYDRKTIVDSPYPSHSPALKIRFLKRRH